jgi:hypothetical protein
MKALQEAEELRLRGSDALRVCLRPGRLVKLRHDVGSTGKLGGFDVLSTVAPELATLRAGTLLMMIRIERVEDAGGIRRPCYTFLQMGSIRRCTVTDLSLIEPA